MVLGVSNLGEKVFSLVVKFKVGCGPFIYTFVIWGKFPSTSNLLGVFIMSSYCILSVACAALIGKIV